MHYRPGVDERPLPYDPFKSCTVPRPIGWLSTVDAEGRANLAPYSQWQNLTYDPPMVMFAANVHVDGRRKDTVLNAEATGWFVWNMATWALREAVNLSAMDLAPGEDEFEAAGVTKAPCVDAPGPRVAESPCQFECEYMATHRLPGGAAGPVDVVYGRVRRIHIADEVVGTNGKLDIPRIRPIARMGYYDYCVVDSVFEMKIPNVGQGVNDGLEGRSKG